VVFYGAHATKLRVTIDLTWEKRRLSNLLFNRGPEPTSTIIER